MFNISVFILCWSPYIIFDILQVYELIPSNETVRAIATFIQSLAPLNSAANPVIYFMFSANFSKYFRSVRSNITPPRGKFGSTHIILFIFPPLGKVGKIKTNPLHFIERLYSLYLCKG